MHLAESLRPLVAKLDEARAELARHDETVRNAADMIEGQQALMILSFEQAAQVGAVRPTETNLSPQQIAETEASLRAKAERAKRRLGVAETEHRRLTAARPALEERVEGCARTLLDMVTAAVRGSA